MRRSEKGEGGRESFLLLPQQDGMGYSILIGGVSIAKRYCCSYFSVLSQVFDVFCLRLTDRNSKVNLHALQAFSSMVPVLRSALVPIINPIMGTLVPNLASRNLTIHSTAMTVLDLLSHNIGKLINSLVFDGVMILCTVQMQSICFQLWPIAASTETPGSNQS